MKTPLLIHIPHSSTVVPYDIRKGILLGDQELEQELLKLTDRYTDELFGVSGAMLHVNEVSRIVFDPERFRSDEDEVMAKAGMGVIYTHTTDGWLIRQLSDSRREELVQRFYDPYHKALEEKAGRMLEQHGRCLILDGHSFPQEPLGCELDKNPDRPDICIGTDEYHTPLELSEFIAGYFEGKGMRVKMNSPFAGAIVPMKYYRKDSRVSSVMIEINRKLYMSEVTGEKNDGFASMKIMVQSLIGTLMGA